MVQPALDFHPDAIDEAEAAALWYRDRSKRAAERFLDEIERAIDSITDAPYRSPKYLHETRRYVLFKFPYSIIYRAYERRIVVYAFAHAKRRPGYWKSRL